MAREIRDIEFRGKKNDVWIYGSFATVMDGSSYIMSYCYSSSYIAINEDEKGYLGGFALVDGETVGQFTGMYDKHGKKVFEGDIIKYSNSFENGKGTVEFHSSCFQVVWFEQNTRIPSICTTMNYLQCQEEIEIIGNVFDNPGLLDS